VADQFQSNLCRICTLIFDTDPIEIGRSPTDPTICIICEAHHMATIEPITKTIVEEQFIITLTRSELEQLVSDPQPYVRDFRAVLKGSNATPPPVSKAKRGEAGRGVKKVDQFKTYKCPICKRAFKTQGWLNQHQSSVHDNDTEIGTHQPAEE